MLRRTFLTLGGGALAAPVFRAAAAPAARSAHAFGFDSLDVEGGRIELADHAGRPVLLVNTASRCAFTPQYEALQALWRRYRDRGLVVIGAPSRDFGRQEYEDAAKIREFCEFNFAVDFPMTDLVRVKGPDAHPFYAWAAQQEFALPRWNFHKYLIAPDGALAGAWGSSVTPDDAALAAAIEAFLPRS